MGRYAERAEGMARLLIVTRERYHEFRYRQDMEGSECVPVLLAALGRITGTDTGADGDSHEMIATAPTTLWSLTADRHRPGSLAQSVERLGLSARAVRDQMSNDTWMVLAAVERAVLHRGRAPPESHSEGEAYLVSAHRETLAGMLALSGLAAESMVQDVGWTVMDIGKRIERGSGIDGAVERDADGGPQSRRRADRSPSRHWWPASRRSSTAGATSARSISPPWPSWCCSTPRIRDRLSTNSSGCAPTSRRCGSSRPERMVDEIGSRLRRIDPADLDDATPEGRRRELAALLGGLHSDLRELSRCHHLDTPVPAGRHATAVGTRRAPGDAMTDTRRYQVTHSTVYGYSDFVTSSYGRGFLTPRDSPGQRCLSHRLLIDPEPTDSSTSRDAYGNMSSYFHVTERHRILSVTSESIVEVDPPPKELYGAGSALAPWEIARPVGPDGALATEFTLDLAALRRSPTACGITPRRASSRADR